jgi:hypothetical protein
MIKQIFLQVDINKFEWVTVDNKALGSVVKNINWKKDSETGVQYISVDLESGVSKCFPERRVMSWDEV